MEWEDYLECRTHVKEVSPTTPSCPHSLALGPFASLLAPRHHRMRRWACDECTDAARVDGRCSRTTYHTSGAGSSVLAETSGRFPHRAPHPARPSSSPPRRPPSLLACMSHSRAQVCSSSPRACSPSLDPVSRTNC